MQTKKWHEIKALKKTPSSPFVRSHSICSKDRMQNLAFSAWLLYVKLRWNKRDKGKMKSCCLGLSIKFLPHDLLWSSASAQHTWHPVYVLSWSSFLTSYPSSSSSIPATLSAQVQMPSAQTFEEQYWLWIRLCSCTQEFRKGFLYYFHFGVVCCCPLEVIQLQCMTQGFQIGTTGHPPEWHVLLRAETPDDEIISDFHLYPTAEIVCDKVYVGKHVSLDRFYPAPPLWWSKTKGAAAVQSIRRGLTD